MGAGKLKTRYYKVRRGGRGWIAALAAGLILAGGIWLFHSGHFPRGGLRLSVPPAPTLTPQDSASDTRVLILPGETWHALQLGAFESPEAARSQAEAYRARGAGGLIWQRDAYRVLAAAYETRADAQAVQSRLQAQHQVDTVVTDITWPDITLRLTGQKAQLDALTDAYAAVSQLTRHMAELSAALDRGEADVSRTISSLESERDTAGALSARLQSLFEEGSHGAVQDLQSLFSDISAALTAALAAPNATQLGAQIKYCQLLCVCRMAAHVQGLSP